MIRVLHSVSYMHRAGVETFLMNYYRHIDRSVVQFDFLCNKQQPGDYDDEIRQLGGRIFYRSGMGTLREEDYAAFWRGFLREHPEIRILHAHNGAKQFFPLEGARQAGLPVRIAHAHSTDFVRDEKYRHRMELIRRLPDAANYYFGCSNRAGEFFFGEDLWRERGVLIHNAVPCREFAFRARERERLRADLGLRDAFAVGHVGRFMRQKNHARLLEIFREVCREVPEARLLLIGSGELEEDVKAEAAALGILPAVRFCGEQADMARWYQAMDAFVMPSLFEGLTIAGIEAQAAGLPCVFSDAVSPETKVTDAVTFVPLSAGNGAWRDAVLRCRTHHREDTSPRIRQAGYNICEEAGKLQRLYCRIADARGDG